MPRCATIAARRARRTLQRPLSYAVETCADDSHDSDYIGSSSTGSGHNTPTVTICIDTSDDDHSATIARTNNASRVLRNRPPPQTVAHQRDAPDDIQLSWDRRVLLAIIAGSVRARRRNRQGFAGWAELLTSLLQRFPHDRLLLSLDHHTPIRKKYERIKSNVHRYDSLPPAAKSAKPPDFYDEVRAAEAELSASYAPPAQQQQQQHSSTRRRSVHFEQGSPRRALAPIRIPQTAPLARSTGRLVVSDNDSSSSSSNDTDILRSYQPPSTYINSSKTTNSNTQDRPPLKRLRLTNTPATGINDISKPNERPTIVATIDPSTFYAPLPNLSQFFLPTMDLSQLVLPPELLTHTDPALLACHSELRKAQADAEQVRNQLERIRIEARHQERMSVLALLNKNFEHFASPGLAAERSVLLNLLEDPPQAPTDTQETPASQSLQTA
ncbi:hypothetical protein RI367_002681 [Sorochytrium milnesiophthora]